MLSDLIRPAKIDIRQAKIEIRHIETPAALRCASSAGMHRQGTGKALGLGSVQVQTWRRMA